MEFFTLKSFLSVRIVLMVIAVAMSEIPIGAQGSSPGRIDTHQHIIPGFYGQKLKDLHQTAGGAPIPAWSEEDALKFMDGANISKGILSVSAPGAYISESIEETRILARQLNEYASDLQKRNSEKFGFFATLTLPDVEGSVAEAKYALDVLGAHGVILMASTNGVYLGHASLEPLMEVLSERNAIVFVHPDKLAGPAVEGIPPFIADFLLDTTRAAINLLRSGTTTRYPNIKFILSHGGGFLPYAAYRIAGAVAGMKKVPVPAVLADMKRFYFDTALSATDTTLPSLTNFAHDHIVYGSDFPFVAPSNVALFNNIIQNFPGLSASDRELLNHLAAKELFKFSNGHLESPLECPENSDDPAQAQRCAAFGELPVTVVGSA